MRGKKPRPRFSNHTRDPIRLQTPLPVERPHCLATGHGPAVAARMQTISLTDAPQNHDRAIAIRVLRPSRHRERRMHARAGFPESFTHWLISAARGPTKNHGLLHAIALPPRPAAGLADRIGRPQGQDERPQIPQTREADLAPRPRVVSRRPATGRLRKPWALSAPISWISKDTGLHVPGITEAQVFGVLYHRKTVNPYPWISILTAIRATGDLRACAGHPAQDPAPPPRTRPP